VIPILNFDSIGNMTIFVTYNSFGAFVKELVVSNDILNVYL